MTVISEILTSGTMAGRDRRPRAHPKSRPQAARSPPPVPRQAGPPPQKQRRVANQSDESDDHDLPSVTAIMQNSTNMRREEPAPRTNPPDAEALVSASPSIPT